MRLPFRDHHLIQFLETWQPTLPNPYFSHSSPNDLLPRDRIPAAASQSESHADSTTPLFLPALDRALHQYFREHKALGSKDREAIASEVYQLVRWQLTLDALHRNTLPQQTSTPTNAHPNPQATAVNWQQRLTRLRAGELEQRHDMKPNLRVSMPLPLFELLVESWGEEKAIAIAETLQYAAPVFLRANALKISRDELLAQLPEAWQAKAFGEGHGIQICARPAIFQNPLFQSGHFEMQDEGSQQLAAQVHAKPGDWVLDYCAGSGGKALAIAPTLQEKGQLFLHDVRVKALIEARKRLKRAGIQNAQFLQPDHPQLKKLRKSCQWVLVDAPCSGTGTLRRNPDMKNRLNRAFVQQLVSLQRRIFERALSFLAPGGTIVYATCSILRLENEQQIEHFLATYDLELVQPSNQLLPETGGHDGFFVASMKKRTAIKS